MSEKKPPIRAWRAAAAQAAREAAAGPTFGPAPGVRTLTDDQAARAAAEEAWLRHQARKGPKSRE